MTCSLFKKQEKDFFLFCGLSLHWSGSLNFLGGTSGKELPIDVGDIRDMDSILGSGRSPGGGHGDSLQHSCLENPMDRGAWQAAVHGVTQSQTWWFITVILCDFFFFGCAGSWLLHVDFL